MEPIENSDIPSAEDCFKQIEKSPEEVCQNQLKECLEAIKKINQNNSSVSLIFHATVSDNLIETLKEKGYVIKYFLDYDSSRSNNFVCRLKIINPNFNDPATSFMETFEDNIKNMGFNQSSVNTEENFKKLFNSFLNL